MTGRLAVCGRCGKLSPIAQRATADEPALGRCCWRAPIAVCSRCGRRRPCRRAHTAEPVCDTCSQSTCRCSVCGRSRPVAARVDGEPLCGWCWRTRHATDTICARCGARGAVVGGLCCACRLDNRVAQLRNTAQPSIAERMAPYLDALAGSPTPASTLRWMQTPSIKLLQRLLTGDIELSHRGLDEEQAARPSRAITSLPAALVEHAVLDRRDETSARFAQWLPDTLAKLPDGADRTQIRAFATWEIATQLAQLADHGPVQPSAIKHAHSQVRQAVLLTGWLHAQDLTLLDLHQDLLGSWITGGSSTRYAIHGFISWLNRSGPNELRIRWPSGHAERPFPPDTTHLAALRTLVNTPTLDTRLRFAGALVLLLGQPLTRIVALRREDVTTDDGHVRLRLGSKPTELPVALGELALDLRDHPAGKVRSAPAPGPWLLPGRNHGQHLTAEQLRRRLKPLGFTARPARRGALLALAAELPAPVLAERLGIHPGRAAQWTQLAGNTYADYVAAELAASQPHNV
jgi:integrase